MPNVQTRMENIPDVEERDLKAGSGLPMLIINSLLIIAGLAVAIYGSIRLEMGGAFIWVFPVVVGYAYSLLVGWVLYLGIKILKPNEAMVITLFGRYKGTLQGAGIYYVNPFCGAVAAPVPEGATQSLSLEQTQTGRRGTMQIVRLRRTTRKISLKAMTLNNQQQKINDRIGNPINIGIVVIWRVVDTAKAVFSVDNYVEFLSVQTDSALRNIVRLYPYDAADNEDSSEKSLRGSSQEIAAKLRDEIQEKAQVAGLEIIEARITNLAYAPEIAAAMLQRQQASAIVDARQLIVEGAVGMVEMALAKLSANGVVELDEERKAAMVSNLMVVLCGNRDAQPVVNSGSLY